MSETSFMELMQLDGVIGGVLFNKDGEVLLMQLPSIFSFDIVIEALDLYLKSLENVKGEFACDNLERVVARYEYGAVHIRSIGSYRIMALCNNTMDMDLLTIGFNLLAYKITRDEEALDTELRR